MMPNDHIAARLNVMSSLSSTSVTFLLVLMIRNPNGPTPTF